MSEKFEVKDGLKIPSGKQLELNGVSLSAITTDITLSGDSSTALPTESAVKGYVDAHNQWTITDGTSSSVIEAGDSLQINGTSNEVEVAVDGDAFTVGLPVSVDITTDLEVSTLDLSGGSISDSSGAISFDDENLSTSGTLAAGVTTITGNLTASGELTVGTVADGTSMATSAAPSDPADIANKKYVDDQLGSTAMSAATDTGDMNPIDLDSETLTLSGGEGMNVTHSGNTVTFAGELASETNPGVATFDGTDFTVVSGDVTVNSERVEDIIGGMLSGNTESGISVSYQDSDGTIDFDVNDPTITINGDVSGSATMNDLGDLTITVAQQNDSVDLTTHTTGNYVATVAGGTGLTSNGAISGEGITHSLSVDASQDGNIISANSLVTVGALASGSIASGFGTITTLSACDLGATTVDSIDVSSGGISQAGSIAGASTIDGTGDLTMGTITMPGFTVDADGDTVVRTLSSTEASTLADASSLATSAAPTSAAHIANKAYVDSKVTAADLDFTSDGNETLSIDLDSETLDIAGGSNLTTSAADNTITVKMDSDISLTSGTFSSMVTTVALSATGATNLDSTLDVDGQSDLKGAVNLAAAGVATDIKGSLSVDQVATFDAESVHSQGIDCNGQLSMETNDIVGTADNMLLQADGETAHSFGDDTNKMALQALSGIEMVNNVKFSADIESNIIPDDDSTRTLGDGNNHWSTTFSDTVVYEHGKTTSFSGQPGSAAATAVMSFPHASFKSAKVNLNVKSGSDYTAREVLIVCKDDGTSPKLVEYGILSTNTELGTLSVAVNGNNIELKVAAASGMPCTGVVTLSE